MERERENAKRRYLSDELDEMLIGEKNQKVGEDWRHRGWRCLPKVRRK